MHDALEDVSDRLPRADNTVPDAGGTPADGLAEWSPPWWIDQTRTPMINTRSRSTHAARQHRRQ